MKIEKMACPLCESQKFHERDDHAFSFKQGRKTHIVDHLKHHACDDCGFSIFTPEQQDFNNQRVKDFQASLEDFVSPSQVLELREKYLITQTDANKIFGGGPTAFSKYERGVTSRVPELLAKCCMHWRVKTSCINLQIVVELNSE
jgi:HTH-type transcriptional regulator/antitoxin MqsA